MALRPLPAAGDQLAACAAGLFAGTVVLGVGGRLAMALIQVAHGVPSTWSWGGSWQVILPGVALGPAAGLAYATVRSTLRGTTALRGLTFGAVHAAFWITVYFLRPAGPVELRGAPLLGGVLFALLLLGFGMVLALLDAHWRPALAERRVARPALVAVWTVAVVGVGFTFWVLAAR